MKQLKVPRDEVVILTKVFYPVGKKIDEMVMGSHAPANGYFNRCGLSRKHIFDSVDASLERLGLDYIVSVLTPYRLTKNSKCQW